MAALALACALTPAAQGQTPEARSALAQAANHDKHARKHDKLKKKELRKAGKYERQAKKSSGKKQTTLKKKGRKCRKRAKTHKRKAAWHRKQAARLRKLAAGAVPVATAAAAPAAEARRAVTIPMGTASSWSPFAAQDLFLRYFDQLTPENELKMYALQPAPGVFNFATADAMVNWARAAGKPVRGHTLIYGSQLPGWITGRAWTRAELLAVMEEHITRVMQHFRGRIGEWDVVNEAIGGDGGRIPNLWQQVIGDDYVEKAFQFARAADPSARLYYNEGGVDLPDHPRTQGARALVSSLRSRGVPVQGVGMQNHMTNRYYASSDQVLESINRFGALGVDVAVTEMDVVTDGGTGRGSEWQTQAAIFGGSARACRQSPYCTSFTTWGIADPYSWLGAGAEALMFDAGHNPKPAFHTVNDWLRNP